MYKILILVAVVVFGYGFYEYNRTQFFIKIGVEIAENANKYEQSGEGAKVLFLGDSSAVGTGSLDPKFSVAGYLGSEFLEYDIENLAVNGFKIEDVVGLLSEQDLADYDLIVLQIGGNDIVRLVDIYEIEKNLKIILGELSNAADKIIVFHGGNVGTSKLFPWFLRRYYTNRTLKVRDVYMQVVAGFEKAFYVDMYRNYKNDPFYLDPEKYYAADYFHPSDAGYLDWYNLMKDKLE